MMYSRRLRWLEFLIIILARKCISRSKSIRTIYRSYRRRYYWIFFAILEFITMLTVTISMKWLEQVITDILFITFFQTFLLLYLFFQLFLINLSLEKCIWWLTTFSFWSHQKRVRLVLLKSTYRQRTNTPFSGLRLLPERHGKHSR